MTRTTLLSFGFTLLYGIILLAGPAMAIVPPSDEEAERLRNAPDLQQRIDRANSLLQPLLQPETIDPVAVADNFSIGLQENFGRTSDDRDFRSTFDLNGDGVIDERDFVELAFIQSNLISREAARSPTHGDAYCAVIPIKFPDVPPDPGHHSDYWDNMFFGDGTYTTRSFYAQVSDGRLALGGGVLTNPAEPDGYWMADYPKTTYSWDSGLLGEILTKADPYYDFNDYDADNSGEADGVFFIYSGDVDGWGDFYWGWATYGNFLLDGVRIGPLMFVGEHLQTYRVAAHEFGHMMGLPDYYDYTFVSAGIGAWGLMGKGEAYMTARSRYKLGWVDPIAIGMDIYDVQFTPRSENGDVYRLWHMGQAGPEYFLLEMVTQTGYDYKLPGAGLMIWHVDDTRSNNNNWQRKVLDVEEADGRDDLDHLANWGDDTDPYYFGNNDTFNSDTYPNSDAYAGWETAVQVLNVSAITTMSADLIIGIPGNLEVDEIEPNDVWNDEGVIHVPDPNGIPDGKVDFYTDPSDFWYVTVFKPMVMDITLDSYNDGVNLSLLFYGPGASGPIEIADTTWADEHIRAYGFIPGNHVIEVRAESQAAYYDLHIDYDLLPEPGEVELMSTPLLPDSVYDNTRKIPAMRLEVLNSAGLNSLESLTFYTQGSYPSCIDAIELWLDNGDDVFGPGQDTSIARTGGPDLINRVILDGINQSIASYAVFFVTIDLKPTDGGQQVGLSVISYKDVGFSNGTVVYPGFSLDSGVADVFQAPMPLSYVAAGDFKMGSDPETDPYYIGGCDLSEETPPHMNRTGDYYISQYEVTCYQYSTFMDDLGYDTYSYWSSGGWNWKNNNNITAPRYWNDPSYMIGVNYPNHPVAGVSWYEAAAFCNYFGGRLPQETEWEKSGRGTDGRIYTYGNVYDPMLFAGGYWPEPVGSYPDSDSLYGVSDLCGNIFEWTATFWQWGLYQRYSEGAFDPPGNHSYALQRGYRYLVVGDCDQDYATRLSYRDTWPKTYRWSIVGFRVAFDQPG